MTKENFQKRCFWTKVVENDSRKSSGESLNGSTYPTFEKGTKPCQTCKGYDLSCLNYISRSQLN